MIRTAEKPECFKHLEDGFDYFDAFKTDNGGPPYLHTAVMCKEDTAYVHLELEGWSHNVLKILQTDWSYFKKSLKHSGIKTMIITKEGDLDKNKSYIKFLSKLNLTEPKEILLGVYEV